MRDVATDRGGDAVPMVERASVVEPASLVEPALRRVVDSAHPDLARICRYHMGMDGGGSGKRVRATLAVLSARAAGGGEDVAAAAGVAVELVHQFSLLHDDVMDGDRQRRGRDAAWVAFGTGPAVLSGDRLLTAALTTASRAAAAPDAVVALMSTLDELMDGQAEDLAFERRAVREVTPEQYLRMARQKTGVLLGCSAGLGARMSGRPALADVLGEVGEQLGRAFQITDDVLGLWGDGAVTGKPVGADALRRKKTLPLLLGAHSATPEGAELAELVDRGGSGDRLLELLERTGARRRAEEVAEEHLAAARRALDAAGLDDDQRAQWEALLARLAERTS